MREIHQNLDFSTSLPSAGMREMSQVWPDSHSLLPAASSLNPGSSGRPSPAVLRAPRPVAAVFQPHEGGRFASRPAAAAPKAALHSWVSVSDPGDLHMEGCGAGDPDEVALEDDVPLTRRDSHSQGPCSREETGKPTLGPSS